MVQKGQQPVHRIGVRRNQSKKKLRIVDYRGEMCTYMVQILTICRSSAEIDLT